MNNIDVTGLIRTGIVMDINAGKRLARVKFPGEHSGWLYVLQHMGAAVTVETADGHTHRALLDVWMPQVNDQVLVLYLPVDGVNGVDIGDGFILGVV